MTGSNDKQTYADGRDSTDRDERLSRRRVFKTAIAAAAVGAAGGSVLTATAASASPENSALPSEVAPGVVFLADAKTIAVDATRGNDFRVTLHGNRAMGNPSHSTDGQKIVLQITQDAVGSRSVTWGKLYEYSSSLPRPTLSVTPGHTDLLGFIYNKARGKWLFVAFVRGFGG